LISDKTRERLGAGEAVLGYFAPAGVDEGVAGTLRWREDGGAMIELLEEADWPGGLGEERFVVHCLLGDQEEVTVLGAWVKTVTDFKVVTRIVGSTLLLGEQVERSKRWPRAFYRTANLTAWRKVSGLERSWPRPRKNPELRRLEWDPPAAEIVKVKGAELRFATASDFESGYSPVARIATRQRLVVNPLHPMTIDRLMRDYAIPLVSLTAFAADRPDGLLEETYFDPESGKRVEVWRSGRDYPEADWWDRMLFEAADLKDFRLSVVRWWRLFEKVRPALAIFADHLREGNSYSPGRLLTAHTALAAYCDAGHGHRKFKKLSEFTGVPEEVTGTEGDALALIGKSRDYFSHLGSTRSKFTVEEIEANAPLSTRRIGALMQSCLLRELGFTAPQTTRLLRDHYRNWPLGTRGS
jgi:hypothetical protein